MVMLLPAVAEGWEVGVLGTPEMTNLGSSSLLASTGVLSRCGLRLRGFA